MYSDADDEPIASDDGLNIYNPNLNENSRAVRNFSRILESTDDGKTIRCMATHIALDRPLTKTQQLDVQCELIGTYFCLDTSTNNSWITFQTLRSLKALSNDSDTP